MSENQVGNYFSQTTTAEIAQNLLGRLVTFQSSLGRMRFLITETEAYIGKQDRTAHANWQKKSARNAVLWAAPGSIYVYQLRAQYLLNFVTQQIDNPQGILIRGIEPVAGLTLMQKNRPVSLNNLTNGPGKLTQALGINLELNGKILNASSMSINLDWRQTPAQICQTARVGVPNKGFWTAAPLRYYVSGNPFVSQIKRSTINDKTFGWLPVTEGEEK